MTRKEEIEQITAQAINIVNKPFNEEDYQILKQNQRLRECLENMTTEQEYICFREQVIAGPSKYDWFPHPSQMGIGDD